MRRIGVVIALALVAAACGEAAVEEDPTTTAVIVPPREVAQALLDALIDEEYDATEGYVDERHLAFLTAIERGTSAEVAGMLRAGVPNDVRWDFWSSFSESLPTYTGESLGRVQIGSVLSEFDIGGSTFAAIDMFVADGRAEWIMRLTDSGWVLDLLATFGTGFFPNLRGWFAVIGADADAAYIRNQFEVEIPSVRAGLERLPLGPLSDDARAAADELLVDFGG